MPWAGDTGEDHIWARGGGSYFPACAVHKICENVHNRLMSRTGQRGGGSFSPETLAVYSPAVFVIHSWWWWFFCCFFVLNRNSCRGRGRTGREVLGWRREGRCSWYPVWPACLPVGLGGVPGGRRPRSTLCRPALESGGLGYGQQRWSDVSVAFCTSSVPRSLPLSLSLRALTLAHSPSLACLRLSWVRTWSVEKWSSEALPLVPPSSADRT